ncbi:MAG: ABC transporter ATP-binding protein, partial [Pseudomonadota bacterium]
MALLDIKDLTIEYPDRHGVFTAVKGVSLHVDRGEILGIVGESGAGKSTIGNAVMGLLQSPGRIGQGEIYLDGERLDTKTSAEMRPLRGKRIGMIFQDPMTSLNPLETVEAQLVETIDLHLKLGEKASKARAVELLDQVGIAHAEERIKQYPHEFSWGMRQRVVIALALCAEPDLIIADEPTTALDVSIQAQILELIKTLCRERQVGMILVTHDMGVIAETADRVAVMYRGNLVEIGVTKQITQKPKHEYTKVLISAVPPSNHRVERFVRVNYQGDGDGRVQDIDLETHWLGQGNARAAIDGPILSVTDLNKIFKSKSGLLAAKGATTHAVKDASFDVAAGETFGIVGESGSGKSTIARLVTGIHKASSGAMKFDGQDLMKPARGRDAILHRRQIQMIFQDPYSSLNGRMRVGQIVSEPLLVNGLAASKAEALSIAEDLLGLVELD